MLSKYVLMCFLIQVPIYLKHWFFPKKWTRNLETVVNRVSKALKFYFQIYWNIAHQIHTLSKQIIKETLEKKFMFRMNNTGTRTRSRSSILMVNFEHNLHLFFSVSIVDFEHIFVNWDWTGNVATCVVICGSLTYR